MDEHRSQPAPGEKSQQGVAWSGDAPKGLSTDHRLYAGQVVQYVKAGKAFGSLHQSPSAEIFGNPRSYAPCVASGVWNPGRVH
eukprot:6758632-Pyramimonas_sp.AAC.1